MGWERRRQGLVVELDVEGGVVDASDLYGLSQLLDGRLCPLVVAAKEVSRSGHVRSWSHVVIRIVIVGRDSFQCPALALHFGAAVLPIPGVAVVVVVELLLLWILWNCS